VVTGVQTCALPISSHAEQFFPEFFHLLLKARAHYPNLPVT
jgi:hypothetical protein